MEKRKTEHADEEEETAKKSKTLVDDDDAEDTDDEDDENSADEDGEDSAEEEATKKSKSFASIPTTAEPLIAAINWSSKRLCCYASDSGVVFEVELGLVPLTVACSATEIIVGGEDPNQICSLNFSGQQLKSILTESAPCSVNIHKSGSKFACGFDNGMIAVYGKRDDDWSMTKQWQASNKPIVALVWLIDDEICSGNEGGSIVIWNAESGEQIKIIQSQGPSFCCFSPISKDDRFMFSGYENGIVRRHNLEDGSNLEVDVNRCSVQCICINDDVLLTCGLHIDVAAFDIESLAEKWRYQCFATSMVVVNEEVFVGVLNPYIVVLNINTGELVRQFDSKCDGFISLALQPTESPFARFKFED